MRRLQHAARGGRKPASGFVEDQARRTTVEKAQTQRGFELLYVTGDGWMGKPQLRAPAARLPASATATNVLTRFQSRFPEAEATIGCVLSLESCTTGWYNNSENPVLRYGSSQKQSPIVTFGNTNRNLAVEKILRQRAEQNPNRLSERHRCGRRRWTRTHRLQNIQQRQLPGDDKPANRPLRGHAGSSDRVRSELTGTTLKAGRLMPGCKARA